MKKKYQSPDFSVIVLDPKLLDEGFDEMTKHSDTHDDTSIESKESNLGEYDDNGADDGFTKYKPWSD